MLKRISMVAAVVGGLATAACGSDDAATSTTIGPAGGVIRLAEVTLEAPAGALPTATAITVDCDQDAPAGYAASSTVCRFEPAGLRFAVPVRVSFRARGAAPEGVSVFWSRDGGGYETRTTVAAGGVYSAEVDHFSTGFLGTAVAESDAGVDGGLDAEVDTDAGSDAGTDSGFDAEILDGGGHSNLTCETAIVLVPDSAGRFSTRVELSAGTDAWYRLTRRAGLDAGFVEFVGESGGGAGGGFRVIDQPYSPLSCPPGLTGRDLLVTAGATSREDFAATPAGVERHYLFHLSAPVGFIGIVRGEVGLPTPPPDAGVPPGVLPAATSCATAVPTALAIGTTSELSSVGVAGAGAVVATTCASPSFYTHGWTYPFSISTRSLVRAVARDRYGTSCSSGGELSLAIRSACGGTEVDCDDRGVGAVLEPGTYFIDAATVYVAGDPTTECRPVVSVEVADPPPTLTNTTCATAASPFVFASESEGSSNLTVVVPAVGPLWYRMDAGVVSNMRLEFFLTNMFDAVVTTYTGTCSALVEHSRQRADHLGLAVDNFPGPDPGASYWIKVEGSVGSSVYLAAYRERIL